MTPIAAERGKEKENVRPMLMIIVQVEGGFMARGSGVSLAKLAVKLC